MFRVSHDIAISAPADRVWVVSTDIVRWPDWLPTVTAVRALSDGPFRPGRRFVLKQPLQRKAVWEVVECQPEAGFTWHRLSGRLMRLEASHEITPGRARTINRLGIVCAGPLSILLRPILAPMLAFVLSRENAALKVRCEADTAGVLQTDRRCARNKTHVKEN